MKCEGKCVCPRSLLWLSILMLGALLLGSATPVRAANIAVTNTQEVAATPGSVVPPGSLRAAFMAAKAGDTIVFNIPANDPGKDANGVFTINLIQPLTLSILQNTVTIDGYSQNGAQANTLKTGDNAKILIQVIANPKLSTPIDGLTLQGKMCTVKGLALGGFITAINVQQSQITIQGCFIGVKPNGTDAIANFTGIQNNISGDKMLIGGTNPAARNLISGNDTGITCLLGAGGSNIQGNYIGTTADGTKPLGNNTGVRLNSAANVIVGGPAATTGLPPGNLISGNLLDGVLIYNGAFKCFVQGNLIGTTADGSKRLAPAANVQTAQIGVSIVDSSFCQVGTNIDAPGNPDLTMRNVISGNSTGVDVTGQTSKYNSIQANIIGLDIKAATKLPNDNYGILIQGAAQLTTIGGAKTPNIVSGNSMIGIAIAEGATSSSINESLVGTNTLNAAGLGNGGDGIVIDSSPSNSISGAVVVSNGGNGIRITEAASQQNGVFQSYVGITSNKTALGNAMDGIRLDKGASNNKVKQNVISKNNKGINISDVSAKNNLGDPNSIFDNVAIGIDLGDDGPTPESPGEGSGPNNLQHAPILLSAQPTGGGSGVTVSFLLSSIDPGPFHLEFYDNSDLDPAGLAEGQTFLGAIDMNSAGSGSIDLPPAGIITAIATDSQGNTSEFSTYIRVFPPATNVTNQAAVVRGGYNYWLLQGLYLQVVTITNSSASSLPGPISLALDNLSPNATLVNLDGTTVYATPAGSPFIDLVANTGALAPGASVSVVLEFLDPSNTGITYTARVLSGAGTR
jgi:hypothetical protein